MGLYAGIWVENCDQLAAFQNFIIMPDWFDLACFIRLSLYQYFRFTFAL